MAITPAQRQIALTQILAAGIAAGGVSSILPLSQLLPGVTPDQILTALLNALGTGVDAQLTTALNNMVGSANTTIGNLNNQITAQQANVTAWTVV